MGKVPALQTEHGYLSETDVILAYLEDVQPMPTLYPRDAFARAKANKIIKMVELYIEMPAHQTLAAMFGGASLADYQRETIRPMMERGLAALRRLAQFSPWVCGEQFTYADIYLYRSLGVISSAAGKIYDWDALAEVPGLKEWQARVAQRPLTRAIDTETQTALQAFLKQMNIAQ
ncbi:MAG TPA: glutathione binding-like protein, partial [Spongiibacteraceae bacterium]